LKIGPGNHDCNGFLKNFASAAKIVTLVGAARFCARIQKLGVEFRNCSVATCSKSRAATSNHGLSEIALGVFVISFATLKALLTSAV
jgi:hypothetical protein